jgi:hypothetical protein
MRDTPGFRPDESLIEESKSTVLEEPSTVMEVSRAEHANNNAASPPETAVAQAELPDDTKFQAFNKNT